MGRLLLVAVEVVMERDDECSLLVKRFAADESATMERAAVHLLMSVAVAGQAVADLCLGCLISASPIVVVEAADPYPAAPLVGCYILNRTSGGPALSCAPSYGC